MRIYNAFTGNCYANYSGANEKAKKSLEKLSSGLQINRAGDDAAGLAISERMKALISGLDTACINIQEGISLVQTADGSLGQITDSLQRLKTLTVQAANGGLSDQDRSEIQIEVEQIKKNIESIAESTNFNGIKLLGGSNGNTELVAKSDSFAVLTGIAGVCVFDYTRNLSKTVALGLAPFPLSDDSAVFTFENPPDNSHYIYSPLGSDTKSTLENLVETFNNIKSDTSGDPVITAHKNFINDNHMQLQLYGDDVIKIMADYDGEASNYLLGGDSDGSSYLPGTWWSLGGYGTVINFTYHEEQTIDQIDLQVGPSADNIFTVALSDVRNQKTGIDGIDVSDQVKAQNAMTSVDNAIDIILADRSKYGAYQNSLIHCSSYIKTEDENMTAANSLIRDSDVAKETMNFLKAQLLQNTSQFCMIQSNQISQGMLKLLQN